MKVRRLKNSATGKVAVVKVSNGVTISAGYQSIRVDVGVEMPCEVGGEDDLPAAFARLYEFLDEELASRAKEAETLCLRLSEKYR